MYVVFDQHGVGCDLYRSVGVLLSSVQSCRAWLDTHCSYLQVDSCRNDEMTTILQLNINLDDQTSKMWIPGSLKVCAYSP
jgi:hypothetical protein